MDIATQLNIIFIIVVVIIIIIIIVIITIIIKLRHALQLNSTS